MIEQEKNKNENEEYDSLKRKDDNIDKNINTNEIKNKKDINFEEELNNIKEKAISAYEWEDLKDYFIQKYKSVIMEYNKIEDSMENSTNKKDEEEKNEEEKKEEEKNDELDKNKNIDDDIIYYLSNMKKMPFTLQRMAELLLEYNIYYKNALKFNFAFKKLVNIDLE